MQRPTRPTCNSSGKVPRTPRVGFTLQMAGLPGTPVPEQFQGRPRLWGWALASEAVAADLDPLQDPALLGLEGALGPLSSGHP